MKRLPLILLLFVIILLEQPVQAGDLAASLCQNEYTIKDEKMCDALLIGTIDSLYGLGEYCPDGKTSYRYIIDTWRRLLEKKPELKSQPTIISMRIALTELSLACRNKAH